MDTLQVEHLNVGFPVQTGEVAAVRDVSFSIPESGTLGVVGESGSGKSATALSIMRLLAPPARVTGSVRFCGQQIFLFACHSMRGLRRARLKMNFPEPMTA